MRIGIFGGGGFIGSAIVDLLLAEGHAVRVFERPRVQPYRTFPPDEPIEWRTGDFLSSRDVRSVVEGTDAIVHLISTTLPKNSNDDPIYDVQTNVVGTLQMLNAAVAEGVKRVVFISSGGTVYGIPKVVPITEDHPTEPEVSYGITKLAIEKYLHLYSRLHKLEPIILRVANSYGERQRVDTAQGAVAAFTRRALLREPIDIWGDGTVTRDYLHVADVAQAFSQALAYRGEATTFNIGSGRGTSLNELVQTIETILGRRVERNYHPGRSFDVPVSILDSSRAHTEMGWQPTLDLDRGLRRTIAWMEKQIVKR